MPIDIIYLVTYEGDDYETHRELFLEVEKARKCAVEHSNRTPADLEGIPVYRTNNDYFEEYSGGVMTYAGR